MLEPAAVALQAAFLAVLFLFVVWVARSALRDLRRPDELRAAMASPIVPPSPDATGLHSAARRASRARPSSRG